MEDSDGHTWPVGAETVDTKDIAPLEPATAEDVLKSAKFRSMAQDMLKEFFGEPKVDLASLSPLERRIYQNMPYSKEQERKKARGRSRDVVVFEDGSTHTMSEYKDAEKSLKAKKADAVPARAGLNMSDEEFHDFCRLALPEIALRMMHLAMTSNNLKDVKAVFDTLSDRGYGKATNKVEITDPNKDIRAGWVIET